MYCIITTGKRSDHLCDRDCAKNINFGRLMRYIKRKKETGSIVTEERSYVCKPER
jgi:hypothetical protein